MTSRPDLDDPEPTLDCLRVQSAHCALYPGDVRKEQVYMPRFIPSVFVLGLLSLCLAGSDGFAQGSAQAARQLSPGATTAVYPPLFFREDWKYDASQPNVNDAREPEHPIALSDVANPNLEVRLYGDKAGTRTVIQPYNKDITYVMSLLCTSNWAITLRDKNNDVDLTGERKTLRRRDPASTTAQPRPGC